MGKKKREPSSPYSEPRRAIRLFVLEEEHREIRLAAAENDLPMSEFCRQAAVKHARELRKRTAK